MVLSDDAIARSIRRDQPMLAARQPDPQRLVAASADVDAVSLAIEGRQPEPGHETLSVVRALVKKRVWFAETWLASATAEGPRLRAQARSWAAGLDKGVRRWMSDQAEAFVRGIAAECPGVPPRDGAHHCVRDGAKPVCEADSRATGQRRRQVRGWRTIAREG